MRKLLIIVYIACLITIAILGMITQCQAEDKEKPYYVTTWPDSHSWLKENGWLKSHRYYKNDRQNKPYQDEHQDHTGHIQTETEE